MGRLIYRLVMPPVTRRGRVLNLFACGVAFLIGGTLRG